MKVDPAQVTVSGVSAGGYMAAQLQVAYSSTFKGLGMVAGGPWNCANGSAWTATGRCMKTAGDINTNGLLQDLKEAEARNKVDAISNLSAARIYILNSANDTVVRPPMLQKNIDFYSQLVPASSLKIVSDVPTEHTFPTLNYGNACDQLGSPYLSACNYDGAGEILNFVYPQKSLNRGAADPASLHRFDQSPYADSLASLSNEGWIYVPRACEDEGAHCALHVALHGCSQGSDAIKDIFVTHAGYNEWAEASGIIVLYPQTYARIFTNPEGCFDWFGYTGSDYANKAGYQMRAIKAMVDRLSK
ncbi:MAG: PHB depolymerase [Proteobacteria bacterium]|nr:MAG: PHB depolymerase [Pseudomonadota bacterium]